jgi:hypothetical protein
LGIALQRCRDAKEKGENISKTIFAPLSWRFALVFSQAEQTRDAQSEQIREAPQVVLLAVLPAGRELKREALKNWLQF